MLHSAQEELLARACKESDEGRTLAAVDLLVERLDAWLTTAEFDRVRWLLEHLDTDKLPPEVLTPILSVTRHAKGLLGDTRTLFFDRVMQSLEHKWRLPPEQRDRVAERLR